MKVVSLDRVLLYNTVLSIVSVLDNYNIMILSLNVKAHISTPIYMQRTMWSSILTCRVQTQVQAKDTK